MKGAEKLKRSMMITWNKLKSGANVSPNEVNAKLNELRDRLTRKECVSRLLCDEYDSVHDRTSEYPRTKYTQVQIFPNTHSPKTQDLWRAFCPFESSAACVSKVACVTSTSYGTVNTYSPVTQAVRNASCAVRVGGGVRAECLFENRAGPLAKQ